MGILRSDRVSGLGGANAINGSVFFPQNSFIDVKPDSDLALPGDFTIEMWTRLLTGPNITDNGRQLSSKGYFTAGSDGNWYFGLNHYSVGELLFYSYDGQGSAESVPGNIATPDLDRWYHIAAARSGSTLKLFLDGTEVGSGTLSKGLDDGGNNGLLIGGNSKNKGTDTYGDAYGWISNLRIIKGRALYTAAFTVPTGRLEQTSDTVLLCCQSSGNVLEEKTGKILSHNNHQGLSKEASADRLAPDVGEDYGTTFTDNTKFDTLSYMVPPGGTTTQSNRGRGLAAGGYTPGVTDQIYSVEIASNGMTNDFGNLTLARRGTAAVSSSTRAVWAGGYAPGYQDRIDYVTIATSANAIDFGNLDHGRFESSGVSNGIRGVFGPCENPAQAQNVIQYITIATTGNATDFGDSSISTGTKKQASMTSTTRGLFAGGQNVPSPSAYYDVIQYITIASTGNAQDFGDLTQTVHMTSGVSSSTRGVRAGGQVDPSQTNTDTIDFVTIASTGNATDFGNLSTSNQRSSAMSNSIRGLFSGGGAPNSSTQINTVDKITIASTGNATDWGDYFGTKVTQAAGCSDSHGGLS